MTPGNNSPSSTLPSRVVAGRRVKARTVAGGGERVRTFWPATKTCCKHKSRMTPVGSEQSILSYFHYSLDLVLSGHQAARSQILALLFLCHHHPHLPLPPSPRPSACFLAHTVTSWNSAAGEMGQTWDKGTSKERAALLEQVTTPVLCSCKGAQRNPTILKPDLSLTPIMSNYVINTF